MKARMRKGEIGRSRKGGTGVIMEYTDGILGTGEIGQGSRKSRWEMEFWVGLITGWREADFGWK